MGLTYELELPPLSAPDVKKRVVKISVDGVDSTIELHFTESRVNLKPIKEGSSVNISLKDIDDGGNESEWSDPLSFIAKDTLPPPKPGQVAVVLTGEVADSDLPVPPPSPEPPVVDETPVNVVTGDAEVKPSVSIPEENPPPDSEV